MNEPASADFDDLSAAVETLRAGGVVAFPTETVYGLGADAFNEDAVRRVFEMKGRPSNNPLIVHVSGPAMAQRVAAEWPLDAAKLATAFWPGPLSIVLRKRPEIPDIVAGGPGATTVALRCPDHPVALALLYHLGQPLVGPSANKSGSISPTTAQHVIVSFPETALLVLDGGACATGIESTVVSLVEPIPRILRAGVVSADDIAAVLGKAVRAAGDIHAPAPHATPGAPLPSPGLLARHYAPKMTTRLLSHESIVHELAAHPAGPLRVVIGRTIAGVMAPHALIPMPYAAAEYAAVLYAALHHAESMNPAEILIEEPPRDHPTWHAIWDRLRRASAK